MTTSTLSEQISQVLNAHDLLGQTHAPHFLVAFSGGRDSTALLHVLSQLKEKEPAHLSITAAYYWHPWRPLQHDMQIVHQTCQRLGVPLILVTPNVAAAKTETVAREERYKQFANLVVDIKADALLTAHHQDDQIETILFRLFRGTGVEGIQGIPEKRLLESERGKRVPLFRPMLGVKRTEIDAHIAEHHLQYVEDPTNQDIKFKRNFIRQALMPQIEAEFPQLRQSIMRFADLLDGDLEIIESKVNTVWQEVFDAKEDALDELRFIQLNRAMQRRILRKFLAAMGEEHTYHRVEDLIDYILGKNRQPGHPGLYSLGPNRFVAIYRGQIEIEERVESEIEAMTVNFPNQVSHRKLRATLSITPLTQEQRLQIQQIKATTDDKIYADLSQFEGQELTLRSRQKGDRIHPIGMPSVMKLKRFLMNRAIPRFERDQIPVLAAENNVLWVVGHGISEQIKVKGKPTHIIQLLPGEDATHA